MLALVLMALSPGEVGYQFLLLPYSVEEAVFSSASARLVDPGLAPEASFSGMSFVAGIKAGKAGGKVRGLYLEGLYLNSGNMPAYDEFGNYLGRDFAYHAGCFSGTKAFPWRGFLLRVSPELLFQSADGNSALAGALTLGLLGRLSSRWGSVLWGLDLVHAGAEIIPFESVRSRLPVGLEAGARWTSPGGAWEVGLSGGSQRDYPVYLNLGTVVWPYGYPLGLAFSYNSRGRELNTGSGTDILNGTTVGALFELGPTRLGYSWTPFGELGDVHRLQIDLGCPR